MPSNPVLELVAALTRAEETPLNSLLSFLEVQDERYDGVCDKDGCDFNSWRLGDRHYYGRGRQFDVNSRTWREWLAVGLHLHCTVWQEEDDRCHPVHH